MSQSAGAAFLYCVETWHLGGADLAALRTWEDAKLRRMVRLRRKPLEFHEHYMKRAAAFIHAFFRAIAGSTPA